MNYFKFSKYTLTVIFLFLVASFCIMFNFLTDVLLLPAFACLSAGFIMIAVRKCKNYGNEKKDVIYKQEELIMELASTENGEKYVLENGSYAKRLKKQLRSQKWNLLLPIFAYFVFGILFLALLIKIIVGLV